MLWLTHIYIIYNKEMLIVKVINYLNLLPSIIFILVNKELI